MDFLEHTLKGYGAVVQIASVLFAILFIPTSAVAVAILIAYRKRNQ